MFLVRLTRPLGKYPNIVLTYFFTLIGWVLFRAETFTYAFEYLGRMFAFDSVATDWYFDDKFRVMLVLGAVFGFIAGFGKIESWWMNVLNAEKKGWVLVLMIFGAIIFAIICIASVTSSGFNPFIYFRF